MVFSSGWMLALCIVAGVLCFCYMQWQEYKRSVASGEFRHPLPATRTLSKLDGVKARQYDIEQNLHVGEWLPTIEDKDHSRLDEKSSLAFIDLEVNVVRDPMDQLRDVSKLVSPTMVVSSGECAICLSAFETHQPVCESNHIDCVHIFHKECMIEWLLKKDTCPICRICYLETYQ